MYRRGGSWSCCPVGMDDHDEGIPHTKERCIMTKQIPIGKEVKVKATSGAGYQLGEVVKDGYQQGNHQYLIEYEDETRSWVDEKRVKRVLPNMQRENAGGVVAYEDIDLFETEDWITLFINGEVAYDGHRLGCQETLDVLNIEYNYSYLTHADDFREQVENHYGPGKTRA